MCVNSALRNSFYTSVDYKHFFFISAGISSLMAAQWMGVWRVHANFVIQRWKFHPLSVHKLLLNNATQTTKKLFYPRARSVLKEKLPPILNISTTSEAYKNTPFVTSTPITHDVLYIYIYHTPTAFNPSIISPKPSDNALSRRHFLLPRFRKLTQHSNLCLSL